MTEALLTLAAQGDEESFRRLTEPYRRELQLHCYRILGSMHDAEDMLQETMLAAWRGLERFERRASLRNWLYRIATNRCLNALRDSGRRPPTAREFAFRVPEPTRVLAEPTWLEPYPDLLLEGIIDTTPGPHARYDAKETVELAFIAAIQQLPPRQRAVLVLRDVLGFHAGEVAAMLETTEEAVKGTLKRARAAVEQRRSTAARDAPPAPNSPEERELARRFADAFEANDVDGVVKLLTDDAWLTMPPATIEYQGREPIRTFFRSGWHRPEAGRHRLLPTRGQHAARVRVLPPRPRHRNRAPRRHDRPHAPRQPHRRRYSLPRPQRHARIRTTRQPPERGHRNAIRCRRLNLHLGPACRPQRRMISMRSSACLHYSRGVPRRPRVTRADPAGVDGAPRLQDDADLRRLRPGRQRG